MVTQPGFFWPWSLDCEAAQMDSPWCRENTEGLPGVQGQHGWPPHGALPTCTSPNSVSPPHSHHPQTQSLQLCPTPPSPTRTATKNILGLGVFILFSCLKRYISVYRHNLIIFPIFMKLLFFFFKYNILKENEVTI